MPSIGKQHPCSVCDAPLASDDCYDLLLERRIPTNKDRQGKRGNSVTKKYLPPVRYVAGHIYLCKTCAKQVADFMETLVPGSMYEEVDN